MTTKAVVKRSFNKTVATQLESLLGNRWSTSRPVLEVGYNILKSNINHVVATLKGRIFFSK